MHTAIEAGLVSAARKAESDSLWVRPLKVDTYNLRKKVFSLAREVRRLKLLLEQGREAFLAIQNLSTRLKRVEEEISAIKKEFKNLKTPPLGFTIAEQRMLDSFREDRRKTNKMLAEEFRVSERTVKFHLSNILRKMGLATRHEL